MIQRRDFGPDREGSSDPSQTPADSEATTGSEATQVEQSIKTQIASRITEHQYSTWFNRVHFVFSGPQRVTVTVPNKFYHQYLKSRFLTVIHEAIEAALDLSQLDIEFKIEREPLSSSRLSVDQGDVATTRQADVVATRQAEARNSKASLNIENSEANPPGSPDPSRTSTESLSNRTSARDGQADDWAKSGDSDSQWRKRPWSSPEMTTLGKGQKPEGEASSTDSGRDGVPAGETSALAQGPFPDNIPLNGDYTFGNFIEGPSNRLAFAACQAVAETRGTTYNPLFLYGRVGLGKTHLLQAVAHEYGVAGLRKVVYLSCASFTNDFIAAVGGNDLERFRRKYREADALLIDDIQFLANKERTQEEFFHTFNSIYNQQKQILLTSDCLPSDISGLSERLVSRFKLGLVAQISPPDFETRVAILLRKAQHLRLDVSTEVAEFVAQKIRDNIRELEGAVLRLHTMVTIEKKSLTIDEASEALSDLIGTEDRRISLEEVQQAVLKEFNVRPADLHSRKRTRTVVVPRQICMYLARAHTDLSLGEIGLYFGGRDHSTVLHGIEKIRRLLKDDPRIRSAIATAEQHLGC